MANEIILFDLPRKGRCAGWSANVWKTRLAMNYKGIKYRTEWITHDKLEERLSKIVPEPNATGARYTVPTIQFPDGTAIMESGNIAEKLESLYPTPPLRLDNGLHNQLGPIMAKIGPPLIPVFMPRVARDMVVESSAEFYRESKAQRLGMSLDEIEVLKGGDKAWAAAEPGFKDLSAFVSKHKKDDGPFVLGSEVCYADFIIAALLEGFRRIGQDIYDRIVGLDENFARLHQACSPWMKDDQ